VNSQLSPGEPAEAPGAGLLPGVPGAGPFQEQAVMGRLLQGEMAGPFQEQAMVGQLFLGASPVLLLMPQE